MIQVRKSSVKPKEEVTVRHQQKRQCGDHEKHYLTHDVLLSIYNLLPPWNKFTINHAVSVEVQQYQLQKVEDSYASWSERSHISS